MLSAALCSSIPALIKPDSLLRLNAIIGQSGKKNGVGEAGESRILLRRKMYFLCAGEGDGGGNGIAAFVPKYAQEEASSVQIEIYMALVLKESVRIGRIRSLDNTLLQ